MKRSKLLGAAALLLAFAACAPKTVVEGTLKDAPESSAVVVKKYCIDHYEVLDTVRTDAAGKFVYRAKVEKGNPQFLDMYYKDYRIACLLLEQGDNVKVTSDTLGAYSVTGSDACRQLQKIQADYVRFMMDFGSVTSLAAMGQNVNRDLSKMYLDYYRDRLTFVMKNSHSMNVVPVLFQYVDVDFPVFSQMTDAVVFRNIADSLKVDYPESEYVKMLEKEAVRRESYMSFDNQLRNAQEIAFPDIELPGIDSKMQKLSDMEGKVIMVCFWATTAELNMFNVDTLLPAYEKYRSKGFDIYSVSLDVDKTAWATVVRNQKLPWVNVCDTRGIASPYVGLWGLADLPTVFFIVDGEIDANAGVSRPADIEPYLAKKLK